MKSKLFLVAFAATASVLLASCTAPAPVPEDASSYRKESATLEENQKKLLVATPAPVITESLERANIIKRANLFNNPNKLTYVYLVSYGKIMAFHTAKGKISSVSSYLTPQEKLVNHKGEPCERIHDYNGGFTVDCMPVQAPDIDGSYGTNGDGIFFFTTEGAYVEWKGEYHVSDAPLKLTETPSLIRNVK